MTSFRLLRPVFALAFAGVLGCRAESPDPGRTVTDLLQDLRHADEDLVRARRALGALPASSRRDLDDRAKRASVILGRRVESVELIADAFIFARFEVVRTKTDLRGDRAVVEVFGANESLEHGKLNLVREGDRWAVEVPFSDATRHEP